nr:RhuM family protein [Neisseria dumasiana]
MPSEILNGGFTLYGSNHSDKKGKHHVQLPPQLHLRRHLLYHGGYCKTAVVVDWCAILANDELLERIRDIRASEKRVYLRVREIFALAADYQPSFKENTQFFKTIQNKLHFAATGYTAVELVYRRADASKPLMGLTHITDGVVRKKTLKQPKTI